MSELEEPAITVARLLRTEMHVTKDDGSLASINVSGEWQNSDAFKDYDGQVTVGLAESVDQKIVLSGKIRRRLSSIRVNVWATDKPNASESGKTLRGKVVEEVNRIIRNNRNKPNETIYSFVGIGSNSEGSKAFSGNGEDLPSTDWTELSDTNYQKLWYSDNEHYQISSNAGGEYAVLLFRYNIKSHENAVKQIALNFEGYGTASSGNGVTVKVWNHTAAAWQNATSNDTGGADEVLTLTLQTSLTDFIDSDGYVWFLARTKNPSDGVTPAILNCDYTYCTVVANGITYCDIASYRNIDRADVNPFIYRTEFILRSWFLENIGV